MPPARPRHERRTLEVGVALLLLLAALGGWLLDDTPATPAVTLASTAPTRAQPESMGQPTRPASASQPGPDEVDVCGLGIVKANAVERLMNERQAPARQAIYLRLTHSPYEEARAAGLLLQTRDESAAQQAWIATLKEVDTNCGSSSANEEPSPQDSPACLSAKAEKAQAFAQYRDSVTPQVNQLVDMAHHTANPAVFAQAVQACEQFGQRRVMASCQQLNLERWAKLEPDNIVPWMHVAEDAQRRGDAGTLQYALYRATLTHSGQNYNSVAAKWIANSDDGAVPDAELQVGTGLAMHTLHGWTLRYPNFGSYCSDTAVVDANRRQTCDQLATAMVDHPDTAIGGILGARIGQRVGWPAHKVAALVEEARALADFESAQFLQFIAAAPAGCAAPHQFLKQLAEGSALGETAAIRAQIEASGLTVAQVVQAYRARQQARTQTSK